MSDSDVERLEREIVERQERLAEINRAMPSGLTRADIEAMSARQVAQYDPAVVNRALQEESA